MSAVADTLRLALEALQAAPAAWQAPYTQTAIRAQLAALAADEAREPAMLKRPSSPEASAMIDSVLAEYDWPANPKNAARCGYEAARRMLAHPPAPAAQAEQPASERQRTAEALLRSMHYDWDGQQWRLGMLPAEPGEQPAQGLAELPALPAPETREGCELCSDCYAIEDSYSADQMHDYARAALASAPRVPTLDDALAAERERCAKVCESFPEWSDGAQMAAAIRATAAPQPEGGQS